MLEDIQQREEEKEELKESKKREAKDKKKACSYPCKVRGSSNNNTVIADLRVLYYVHLVCILRT